MKKALLILANMAVALTALAQAPTVQWAKSIKSTSKTSLGYVNNTGQAIATDKLGNIYMTGSFTDTLDFDPSEEVSNLMAEVGKTSGFISKWDASGNFVWAIKIGNGINSIIIDSKNNVYSTGFVSYGAESNAFLSKHDTFGKSIFFNELGNDVSQGINKNSGGTAIAIDSLDNVYMAGNFGGERDFDPNPQKNYMIKSSSYQDCFLSKFDHLGNFIWVKHFEGYSSMPLNSTTINSLVVDPLGNLCFTGSTHGGGGGIPGGYGMFTIKMDLSGKYLWGKGVLANNWINGAGDVSGNSITTDALGNIYITGSFRGVVDFDSGDSIFYLTTQSFWGNNAAFVTKLDNEGNFLWAKNIQGNPTIDQTILGGKSIKADSLGNVYITGSFQGTFDFDPNEETYNLASNTGNLGGENVYGDAFILKLNTEGRFIWATNLGDTANTVGSGITLDASGDIYILGAYHGKIDIDNVDLVSSASYDVYVIKLNNPTILGIEEKNDTKKDIVLFPNPNDGVFEIFVPNDEAALEVFNNAGVLIYTKPISSGQNTIDMSSYINGLYFLKLTQKDKKSTIYKIIKQ